MGRRVCLGGALAGLTRYVPCHLQGEDEVDTDIPTAVEGRFFTNPLLKAFWMLIQVCGGTCLCRAWCISPVTMSLTSLPRPQPLFYALRPMFTVPKVPGKWELINVAAAVAFDATVYRFCGLQSVVYLVFSTLLGMGLHPMAGHFVAEHYAFVTGQETYSYYGPLNWFSYFVGYHNEHHDFPSVPWSRLPLVTQIAPEFYSDLPQCYSWPGTVLRYIFDDAISPFSRVKKKRDKED